MFSVRFWGVRGSIPCPGPDTVIYGGNTTCIEIRADDRLLIIDLGSGARALGDWLLANDFKKNGKIKADIFITHTHWDHIIGFPMFSPIYIPGNEFRLTGPGNGIENLKGIFNAQFSHSYWPVRLDELSAKIEYNQINDISFDAGDGLFVKTKYLNHPIACLGYRFDYKGKSIAVIHDHETYNNETEEGALENEKNYRFLKDVDLLIHDSQFTKEEYNFRKGWGHSTIDDTVQTAAASGAKKFVFFHHEPARTDAQLEQIEKSYANNPIPAVIAKEGLFLEV